MNFHPGDRVELVNTTDRLTDLRPGDKGVVRRFDRAREMVYVDWDRGGSLSMCLDAGDEIRISQLVDLAEAAVRAAVSALRDVDQSTLEAEDHASLEWIIDRVDRCAELERLEGNRSAVGRVIGAVSDGADVHGVRLQVRLEPSGNPVLWPLDVLIEAHQQDCLFEIS